MKIDSAMKRRGRSCGRLALLLCGTALGWGVASFARADAPPPETSAPALSVRQGKLPNGSDRLKLDAPASSKEKRPLDFDHDGRVTLKDALKLLGWKSPVDAVSFFGDDPLHRTDSSLSFKIDPNRIKNSGKFSLRKDGFRYRLAWSF